MPAELDELTRKVTLMQMEEAALKKEDDTLSKERLADLQKELAELNADLSNRKAKWENEKTSVDKLSKLREQIEHLNGEMEIAQRNGDYEKAGELQYSQIPALRAELAREEEALKNKEVYEVKIPIKLPVSKINLIYLKEQLNKADKQFIKDYLKK